MLAWQRSSLSEGFSSCLSVNAMLTAAEAVVLSPNSPYIATI